MTRCDHRIQSQCAVTPTTGPPDAICLTPVYGCALWNMKKNTVNVNAPNA
jgi:hypothetical protein